MLVLLLILAFVLVFVLVLVLVLALLLLLLLLLRATDGVLVLGCVGEDRGGGAGACVCV